MTKHSDNCKCVCGERESISKDVPKKDNESFKKHQKQFQGFAR